MTAARKRTPAAKKATAAKGRPATPGTDLEARMARLTTARPKSANSGRAASAMPATAASGPAFPRRITLPLTADDDRALKLAKVDDDVEATARLRAMIALWRQDERLRARIDKLARTMSR